MKIDYLCYDREMYFQDPFASQLNRRRLECAQQLVGRLIAQDHVRAILDIGCGEGYFVDNVYRNHLCLQGFLLALAEPDSELAAALGRRWSDVVVIRAKAEAIPFSMNTFDLVVLWGVLDHIKETNEALLEIARVLRPKGKALILTNNFWRHHAYEATDEMGHWHSFSADALHRALKKAGLRVERTWGNGFPAQILLDRHGLWPGRLERWLGRLPTRAAEFLNLYGLAGRWTVVNPYASALLRGGLRATLADMMGHLWPSRAFDHILVARKR